jgi:N-methylhydantoinase A
MYTGLASSADEDGIEEAFVALESEASARLRHEGVADENALLQRKISMRYSGQWRSLQVPMGSGSHALRQAVNTFHEQYEREFSFRQDDAPVEVYQLHLTAIGKTPKPAFRPAELVNQAPGSAVEQRQVYFGEDGWVETPIYDRDQLAAGTTFRGPAIVNQLDSTTVVPPHTRAEIDEWLNIRIHLEEVTR